MTDQNKERAEIVCAALQDIGCEVRHIMEEGPAFMARVVSHNPDVVIIDADSPDRDTLEQVQDVNTIYPCPIVMFTDDARPQKIAEAIDAGVSAYVSDTLTQERVQNVMDVAIARFSSYSKLKAELNAAQNALEERKLTDRAKGILMSRKGMSEPDAHKALRKLAMDRQMKVTDLAQEIIKAAELLG